MSILCIAVARGSRIRAIRPGGSRCFLFTGGFLFPLPSARQIFVADQAGIFRLQITQKPQSQLLAVQDLVPDGADQGQAHADGLIVELGPQDAGGIQELYAAAQPDPLLAPRDAGLVACLGTGPARKGIDKGRFTDVGDPGDHGPEGPADDPARLVAGDLLPAGLLHIPAHDLPRLLLAGIGRHCQKAPLPEKVQIGLCPRRIRQVRLAQQDHAALPAAEGIDVRIAAAHGDPRIHQFDHQIHQADIFLHHPPGLCHMSRIPLYVHSYLHVIPYAFCAGSTCPPSFPFREESGAAGRAAGHTLRPFPVQIIL